MVSAPSHQATGIVASAAARRTSTTIMFRRRCARRSIQTPAGSEKSRCGSQASAVEDPDLERRRVQREDRRQRDRERADLVSEDRDALPDPEPDEERLPGQRLWGLLPRPGWFDPDGDRHRPRRA